MGQYPQYPILNLAIRSLGSASGRCSVTYNPARSKKLREYPGPFAGYPKRLPFPQQGLVCVLVSKRKT